MEGLEISVLPISYILSDNEKMRIDSGYYSKAVLAVEDAVSKIENESFGNITSIFRKGIFDIKADTYVEKNEGIPFVRIGDLKGGLIQKNSTAWISREAHKKEAKTALCFGDIVLSKTAYAAASLVNLEACNVSQDTVAVKLSLAGKEKFKSGYITSYLNARHGHILMKRRFQGNVQQHLSLDDGKSISIPFFGTSFQGRVHDLVINADQAQIRSSLELRNAQNALLETLGLADWQPPEPLSYVASSKDAFDSGRLDAQFHAPRIQALLDILGQSGTTLSTFASSRREKFKPLKCEMFNYIEIGGVDGSGSAESTALACEDAPSRATWHVHGSDVITSTVRPIRRLSAMISDDQNGFVCSSGFVVLKPHGVSRELLLTYLRLPIICELLDLYSSASMYPAITEADVLGLPFPTLDEAIQESIATAVSEARASKVAAIAMLNQAKRSVEIAIEESEDAALAFLDNNKVGGI